MPAHLKALFEEIIAIVDLKGPCHQKEVQQGFPSSLRGRFFQLTVGYSKGDGLTKAWSKLDVTVGLSCWTPLYETLLDILMPQTDNPTA